MSTKRPAEGSPEQPAAKKAAGDAAKATAKRTEAVTKLRTAKKHELLGLLAGGAGWPQIEGWFASTVEKVLSKGTDESEVPYLPFAIYSDFAEYAPDDMLGDVVAFMERDEILDLYRRTPHQRRTPFLHELFAATKAIGDRCLLIPEVAGRAKALLARTGSIRYEVSLLNKSGVRPNLSLEFLKAATASTGEEGKEGEGEGDGTDSSALPEKQLLQRLLDDLSKEHNIDLVSDPAVLKHCRDLLDRMPRLGAVGEGDISLWVRNLEDVGTAVLGELARSETPSGMSEGSNSGKRCFLRPRVPFTPSSSPLLLRSAAFREQLAMFLVVTVQCSIIRCFEFSTSKTGTRSAPFESLATRLIALHAKLIEAISAHLGAPALAEALCYEMWREACWMHWKRTGCSAKVFEGAEAVNADIQAKLDKPGQKVPKAPIVAVLNRSCCNTVKLPQPTRASKGDYPKGISSLWREGVQEAQPPRPRAGVLGWDDADLARWLGWWGMRSVPPAEWLANETPQPHSDTTQQHLPHPKTGTLGWWQRARRDTASALTTLLTPIKAENEMPLLHVIRPYAFDGSSTAPPAE